MNDTIEPKRKLSMAQMLQQKQAELAVAKAELRATERRNAAKAKAKAEAVKRANLPKGEELDKICRAALAGIERLGGGL